MEHRLIQVNGGERLLPFARARIKELRAAGLTYASQKYLVNGVRVWVKIVSEIDYIYIDGGAAPVDLDSGVVALDSNNLYGPGVLWECAGVKDYQAPFVPKGDGLWRANPSKEPSDQVAGRFAPFKGLVPADGLIAHSFKPQEIPDTDNPGKFKPDPADDALMMKSFAVRNVPASVFTGRCRLFVQAMYGTWLHPDRKTTHQISGAMYGNYGAPYLKLGNYKAGGDKTEYPQDLDLTTSRGVYLDPVQGKHWLIEAPNSNDQVSFYPLVSTPEREALRPYLRADHIPPLTEEARIHLEAYILSMALPDRSKVQRVTTAALPYSDASMGYGWHWNWTGDTAVLVKNTGFYQGHTAGGEAYAMQSQVWTLSITASHDTRPDFIQKTPPVFSAAMAVSSLRPWYAMRGLWEFTNPDFSTQGQDKMLPLVSTPFECYKVPFYAYYEKDVLKLCTITVADVGVLTDVFTGSAYCSAPNRAGCPTLGFQEGWGQSLTTPQHWECSIEVGGTAYGPTCTNHTQSKTYFWIGDKSGYEKAMIGFSVHGTGADLETGYPIQVGPDVWSVVKVRGDYNFSDRDIPWTCAFTTKETSESIQNRGGLVCFTPVYDAEALSIWMSWTTINTKTGYEKHYSNSAGWAYTSVYHGFPGWDDYGGSRVTKYGWDSPNPSTLDSTDAISEIVDATLLNKSKLHVARSIFEATIDVTPFFNDYYDNAVRGGGTCLSNIGGSEASVVKARSLEVTSGITGTDSYDLAFVGWA